MIVGIDEVGRGAWAGPLCVAAVALDEAQINGLTDSKVLSAKKRLAYTQLIRQSTEHIGVGWVSARDIDTHGLALALREATRQSLAQLDLSKVTQIIIDGTVKFADDPRVVTMKQADLVIPSVSAASVIAKVTRDSYMTTMAGLFEGYGFEKNVGYGTKAHMEAITNLGVTPIHRLSFKPMAESVPVSSKRAREESSGYLAETAAARYLSEKGYRILDRNWKTTRCEIDIIAERENRIFFVEVKYRKTADQGGGAAAITPNKLRQMKFAAEIWMQKYGLKDACLSAVEVSGEQFDVTMFIESVRR